jgi:D-ribose pyranase
MLKRTRIINAELLSGLAGLGHRDLAVVVDAGFPIARGLDRIDLSLIPGVPGLPETLDAVIAEIDVEEAVVAQEIEKANPSMLQQLREMLLRTEGVELRMVPHEDFKTMSRQAKFALRTGEITPYSNIILIAGAKTHIVASR